MFEGDEIKAAYVDDNGTLYEFKDGSSFYWYGGAGKLQGGEVVWYRNQ